MKQYDAYEAVETITGINKKLVKEVVEAYNAILIENLINGEEVNVGDCYKIKLNIRPPRTIKNFDGSDAVKDWSIVPYIKFLPKIAKVVTAEVIKKYNLKSAKEKTEED